LISTTSLAYVVEKYFEKMLFIERSFLDFVFLRMSRSKYIVIHRKLVWPETHYSTYKCYLLNKLSFIKQI
jgi:hypothetical protein